MTSRGLDKTSSAFVSNIYSHMFRYGHIMDILEQSEEAVTVSKAIKGKK